MDPRTARDSSSTFGRSTTSRNEKKTTHTKTCFVYQQYGRVVPPQCTLDVSATSYTCVGAMEVGVSFQVTVPGITNDTVTAFVRSSTDLELSDNRVSCKLGQLVVPVNVGERLSLYQFSAALNGASFRWSVLNTSVAWLVQCPQLSSSGDSFVQLGWADAPFGAPEQAGTWIGGSASVVTAPIVQWTGSYNDSRTGVATQGGVLSANGTFFMWGERQFGSTESLMFTIGCPVPIASARYESSVQGARLQTINVNMRAGSLVSARPASITAHATLMTVAWFAGLVVVLMVMHFAPKRPMLALIVLSVSTVLAIVGFAIGVSMSATAFSLSTSRSMGAHGIIGLISFIWLLLHCVLSVLSAAFKFPWLHVLEVVSCVVLLAFGIVAAFLGIYDWSVSEGWYGLLGGWLGLVVLAFVALVLLRRFKERRGAVPKLRQYFAKSASPIPITAAETTFVSLSSSSSPPPVVEAKELSDVADASAVGESDKAVVPVIDASQLVVSDPQSSQDVSPPMVVQVATSAESPVLDKSPIIAESSFIESPVVVEAPPPVVVVGADESRVSSDKVVEARAQVSFDNVLDEEQRDVVMQDQDLQGAALADTEESKDDDAM
jgi:hypothetical protein